MSVSLVEQLLALATKAGATVVRHPGAVVVVLPVDLPGPAQGAALVPLAEAARIAATSRRVLREAIRARALVAFGGQRDRSVRREDLLRWIDERRVAPVAGPNDADIERRLARLGRRKGRAA